MDSTQNRLLHGPLLQVLLAFSLPYLASCFLQQAYGLIDLLVTGQYADTAAVTAVSIGSQIMHMITAMIIGFAVGSTVLVSRAKGAKKESECAKLMQTTVFLFTAGSILLCLLLLPASGLIMQWMNVPEEALVQCGSYLRICFAGLPFIALYNASAALFRALGDSKTPFYFTAGAFLLNSSLDVLLIGPLGMGCAGAAIATVSAQCLCALGMLVLLFKRYMKFDRSLFRFDAGRSMQIARIGAPAAMQDGLIQISFLVITAIGSSRGLLDAAAIGIVEKLIGFLFLVPSAFSQSLAALAGQNLGAGYVNRAQSALKLCISISLIWGVLVVLCAWAFGADMIALFDSDAEVIERGVQYFRTYCFDAIFVAIHFNMGSYFCVLKHSGLSFAQNAISAICFRIPLAWLACRQSVNALMLMGLAAPAGSLFQDIFCLIAWKRLKQKSKPLLQATAAEA